MRRAIGWGLLLAAPIAVAAALELAGADLSRGGEDEGGVRMLPDRVVRGGATAGVGPWKSGSFPTARSALGFAAWGGRLYLAGGSSGSAPLADVTSAAVADDSTVGSFGAATALPSPRARHALVAWGGHLYAIGGSDANGPTASVLVAPIAADGSLGAWSETAALAGPRQDLAAAVFDGRLYAVGGSDGKSAHAEVQVAAVRGDGTLGAWVSTTPLPSAISGTAAAISDGRLWVAGGWDGAAARREVWASTIASDGTLGPFQAQSALPDGLTGAALAAHGGSLFLAGGCHALPCGATVPTVWAAVVGAGGIGPWLAATPLPKERGQAAAAVVADHLFVAGGASPSGGTLAELLAAPLLSDGAPGSWIAGSALPAGTHGQAAVMSGGFLYLSGGCAGLSDCMPPYLDEVLVAPIASDGTVGPFTPTTPLPSPRRSHASFVAQGNLYVAGGCDAFPCDNDLADVAFAPIASDGTLGAWTTTTALPRGRFGHAAAVYLDQVFLAGGCLDTTIVGATSVCQTALDEVLEAPIQANGKLGAWQMAEVLPAPRTGLSLVAAEGGLLALGGAGGGADATFFPDVLYAPVDDDGNLMPWQPTTPLPSGRAFAAAASDSGWLYLAGGCSGTPCDNIIGDLLEAPVHVGGTVGPWTVPGTLPSPRYEHTLSVEDGVLVVAGGCLSIACITQAKDVSSARLRLPSGAIGPFAETTLMPIARYGHAQLVYRGRLYTFGGAAGVQTVVGDVSSAPIAGDGTIGAFTATAALTHPRLYTCAAAWNDRFYVVAGNTKPANLAPIDTVETAAIAADGTVGSWHDTTPLPEPLSLLSCTVDGGRLYVTGGLSEIGFAVPDVWMAEIQPDGDLGPWQAQTPLLSERDQHGFAAYDGYLYVVGGASNLMFRDDVEFAPLKADGTVGDWHHTTGFDHSRFQNAAFAADGHLYVVGGSPGTPQSYQFSGDIQWAAIFPDGTLSEWTHTTPYPMPRQVPGVAFGEGFLYVTGGIGNAETFENVEVAALVGPRARGVYGRVIDLGFESVSIDSITVDGDATRHGQVQLAYRSARGDGVFGLPVDKGAVALGQPVPVAEPGARYLSLRLTLDDGAAATLGPDASGERDVQALEIRYTDHCAAVTCAPSDECHAAGICAPASGSCSAPPVPDGTACSAGLCESGVCSPRHGVSGFSCALSPRGDRALPSLLALACLLAWALRRRRA